MSWFLMALGGFHDKKTGRPGWVTIEKLLEDERLEKEKKEHVKQTTVAKQISKMGSGEQKQVVIISTSLTTIDVIPNKLTNTVP